MTSISGSAILLVAAIVAAGASVWDLRAQERVTLVVYTTPALRDLLEKGVVHGFEEQTGLKVSLVYVAAGEQFNRLRMSGERPEADLLLHASPLYLEQSLDAGYVSPLRLPGDADVPDAMKANASDDGARGWYAFAWSPLVEVRAPSVPSGQDLATTGETFGFPHPRLSNNGVYSVLLFESTSKEAGRNVLAHTRVQPTNARANIGGVADGSFRLTLGYEAVVDYYRKQGASIESEIPLVDGERVTTPVLCSVAVLRHAKEDQARLFVDYVFSNATQEKLRDYGFRGYRENDTIEGARTIHYDWSQWERLEAALPSYEVKS